MKHNNIIKLCLGIFLAFTMALPAIAQKTQTFKNEIYLVALTYKNGSPEFIELFEKAVSLFPDDKIANLNAASAALSREDIALAEKYLKKAEISAPEYENAVGVLYLLKSDYKQAKLHLIKAAESGLEQAYFNLEELNKKEEDIRSMTKLDY